MIDNDESIIETDELQNSAVSDTDRVKSESSGEKRNKRKSKRKKVSMLHCCYSFNNVFN